MTELAEMYRAVRARTELLCVGLSPEDCNLQAMPETSPAKWHLAHTAWFFDTFLLQACQVDYLPVDPVYAVLFNSYYNGIGEQYPRHQRGLLSRPSLDEVLNYRRHIDAAVLALLAEPDHPERALILERTELGLHHEAQHQELLLTDLKYSLFQNPVFPVYRAPSRPVQASTEELRYMDFAGGEVQIGHAGAEFAFDNELPRHPEIIPPFSLAHRLITNAEYLEFIGDGGYANPEFWLADGWQEVQQGQLRHPLYWGRIDGQWFEYSLRGLVPLDDVAPVSHVSFFEASAFATWAGKRLPTESEWECAATAARAGGNFLDQEEFQPCAAPVGDGLTQMFGDCWEWTNSAYLPYPGYRPAPGAVGEYNGKFMSSQFVLRGGSCLSAAFHIRNTYRNFFYARDRWQCTGIRLAGR